MGELEKLAEAMVEYERGCPRRIQHFIKVHGFARWIGEAEGLEPRLLLTLEAAALVHDIGIKPALEKYGSSAGPLQEKEGVGPARALLTAAGFDEALTARVCRLVSRHHTYEGVDGPDWQILLEADYLVNAFEGTQSREAILAARSRFFRTAAGKRMLTAMFDLPEEN